MERCERDMETGIQMQKAVIDTKTMYENNVVLINSIKASISRQEIIPESVDIEVPIVEIKKAKIIVSRKKTIEAASAYIGKKTAVLNIASALCPGGGNGLYGKSQEECLCRQTTLYPCISNKACMEEFYECHRNLTSLYNADMIYTPNVKVFKTWSAIPEPMKEHLWFDVDVVTMAAPDIRSLPKMSEEQLLGIFVMRFTRILQVAIKNGVEVLILGAFGCEEFGNDPAIVATAAARVLENYASAFDTVEFAIYEGRSKKNFHMFRLILDRYMNSQ